MEVKNVFIRVGIPGQTIKGLPGPTVGIWTDLPLQEDVLRKRAKEFRKQVAVDFKKNYGKFGLPDEISGFTPKDFFWAVFGDNGDIESMITCSDNFLESWFWKNPPATAITESPFEDWWYQQGYADAKFQMDNRPKNSKNLVAYKRGIDDYKKSLSNLTKNLAENASDEN
jgi:hypothetical protein